MPEHVDLLARNVAMLLRLRGWSQTELAQRAGMAPGQLSRYMNGKVSPTLDALSRLAKELDVPIARLLGDHDIDECTRRVLQHVEIAKTFLSQGKKT